MFVYILLIKRDVIPVFDRVFGWNSAGTSTESLAESGENYERFSERKSRH